MRQNKPRLNEEAKTWTILIVDDTPDNVFVAKAALAYHGAVVMTANNAEDGFKQIERVRPTCILLDIRMPKVDGWMMFKQLRADPATAAIPVVAMTAYAMSTDRIKIQEAGFDGYIPKPLDINTFVDELDSILKNIKASQENNHESIELGRADRR